MIRHTIETTDRIDILKSILDCRHFTEIYLSAISRGNQHDFFEILPEVGLSSCLHANVTVAAFDGTRRQIQRGRLNGANHVVEGQLMAA